MARNGSRARFAPGGVAVWGGGGWFGLRLVGVGLGGSLSAVGPVVPVARGNRVSFVRRGVREWYANGPLGLEQGFVVARPVGGGGGVLRLSMALSGDLRASLSAGGGGLLFARAGRGVLAYRDLVAVDARGRGLRAWLVLGRGRVEIRVAVSGAAFPVRIDPLAQRAKLTASDGAVDDRLGFSVAVSADGSTVVAGAPDATVGANPFQGAAYVFVKPKGGWSSGQETAKLTASDGAAYDVLGSSVAVSADGSTVLAGRPVAPSSGPTVQGAAYVFVKPRGGWSSGQETAKLTASDGAENDKLGDSVGVSADGSTVLAGAPYATVGANTFQGAAYVFVKPTGGWSSGQETAKLTASDGAGNDKLGDSVGVSADGSTVVASAPYATVGANTWQGAAYVFVKPKGGWSSGQETAKLTASDGAERDNLGYSVGVSADGSTVVAGAPYATVGANTWQGAAYVFVKPMGGWSSGQETAKLTASDGARTDELGDSVGVSADGSTVIAGAGGATVDGNAYQGAAYVFVRPSGGWSSGQETAKLISDGAVNEFLGLSVAVSADGSTVVAGARGATVDGNGFQGVAYVFGMLASPSVSVIVPSSATAGSAVSASSVSAVLSGGASPSGTITFKVFGPQPTAPTSCGSGGITVGSASVSGNRTFHPSAGFTPGSAGDYWWYASYDGDANNHKANSPCGTSMAETVVAPASPSVSVSAPTAGRWAQSIAPRRYRGCCRVALRRRGRSPSRCSGRSPPRRRHVARAGSRWGARACRATGPFIHPPGSRPAAPATTGGTPATTAMPTTTRRTRRVGRRWPRRWLPRRRRLCR